MWPIRNLTFVLVLDAMSTACGGATSADDSRTGGASSTGGSGAASVPPAEAAASIEVSNSADAPAGYACSTAHTLHWGSVPPNATSVGSVWTDGQDGNAVSCLVQGSGAYKFSGAISGSNRVSIQGSVDSSGSGTVQVSFFDSYAEMGIVLYAVSCSVVVTGNNTVEPGTIWASFDCSRMVSSDDAYLWCRGRGTFMFKGCRE